MESIVSEIVSSAICIIVGIFTINLFSEFLLGIDVIECIKRFFKRHKDSK